MRLSRPPKANKVVDPAVQFGQAQSGIDSLDEEEKRILRTIHMGIAERPARWKSVLASLLGPTYIDKNKVPLSDILRDAAAPETQVRQTLARLKEAGLIHVFEQDDGKDYCYFTKKGDRVIKDLIVCQ